MTIKIITISFDAATQTFDEQVLNQFISTKKVNVITPAFFLSGRIPHWTVFIDYEDIPLNHEKKTKEKLVDLNEHQKKLFDALIDLRRTMAEKEGIPLYIIASNKQLSDIVLALPKTSEELKNINGFGTKKLKKYGKQILKTVYPFINREKKKDESDIPPF